MRGSKPASKSPTWKGGRTITSHGYVLVKVGIQHHLADVRGYAYEHRINAEKKIGRRLRKGEQVHHVDGNKLNNAFENLLVVRSARQHRRLHGKRPDRRKGGQNNPIIACKCGCGTRLRKFDSFGRPRRYVSGHNYASRKTLLHRKTRNATHEN